MADNVFSIKDVESSRAGLEAEGVALLAEMKILEARLAVNRKRRMAIGRRLAAIAAR
jgi:hypothetical protein